MNEKNENNKDRKLIKKGEKMSIDNREDNKVPEDVIPDLTEKYRIMASTMYEISKIHERAGQWDEAVHLLQVMYEVIHRAEDKKIEAKIGVLLGDLLWKRGAFHEARTILQKANQLAEETSDCEILGDCVYHLGELYYVEALLMRKRDHTAALEYHNKALLLREKSGDKKGVVQSLSRLGTICEHMKTLDQALEYHNKAITIAREITYEEGLYRPITHIGSFYRLKGDLKTALEHYQEALEICRRIKDRQGLVFALGNVGRTLYDIDKNKNFDDALQLCREALAIAEDLGFILAIDRTLLILGDLYASHGDLGEAKQFFQRLRKLAADAGYEAHYQVAEKKIADLEKS